jgi:hypothetical protein
MELIGKQIAIETILGQPPELHYPSWYAAQIEKLPPAPPEYLAEQAGILVTDDDTISRKAAIDAVEFGITYAKAINKETGEVIALFEESNAELKEAVNRIKQLPPTQPEHIKGHWICDRSWSEGVGMGESYGHYWKCDKCGHLEQGDWGECGCNFCSNCGSDNREATT